MYSKKIAAKPEQPVDNPGFTAWDKAAVDREFCHGERLSSDYINAYSILDLLMQYAVIPFERIKPLRTYEQYFMKAYPNRYAYIRSLSDPAALAEIDRIVEAFNADLPRILAERDAEAIRKFLKAAITFMRAK